MAGVADSRKLDQGKSLDECVALCDDPQSVAGVRYARLFAESDGLGQKEAQAYTDVCKAYGDGKAESLRAICWFLYWGSYTGNTLNGMLGFKPGKPTSIFFKVTFCSYYVPLFYGLINLVAFLISFAPRVPAWFSAFFGVVLATIAGSSFAPLGLLGMLVGARDPMKSD